MHLLEKKTFSKKSFNIYRSICVRELFYPRDIKIKIVIKIRYNETL